MNPITQTIKKENPYRCDKCFIGDLHKARQFNCEDKKCGCPCPKTSNTPQEREIALLESVVGMVEGKKTNWVGGTPSQGYNTAIQNILTELQEALKELKDKK